MQTGEGQLHVRLDPHRPDDRQHPAPRRSGSPTAPSFRSRPLPVGPATGSHRAGSPRPGHQAARIPSPDLAGVGVRPVRGNGSPPSLEIPSPHARASHEGDLTRPRTAKCGRAAPPSFSHGRAEGAVGRRVVQGNGASGGRERRHGPAAERRLKAGVLAQPSTRDVQPRTRRHYAPLDTAREFYGCPRRASICRTTTRSESLPRSGSSREPPGTRRNCHSGSAARSPASRCQARRTRSAIAPTAIPRPSSAAHDAANRTVPPTCDRPVPGRVLSVLEAYGPRAGAKLCAATAPKAFHRASDPAQGSAGACHRRPR